MRKSFTEGIARQRVGEEKSVEVQIPFGRLESLEDAREGFFSLCVSAGRQVFGAIVEQNREALGGPKGVPNSERRATAGRNDAKRGDAARTTNRDAKAARPVDGRRRASASELRIRLESGSAR